MERNFNQFRTPKLPLWRNPFIWFAISGACVTVTAVTTLISPQPIGANIANVDISLIIGIASLAVGIIALVFGIWLAIGLEKTFKQDMDDLRNKTIEPLQTTLTQSLISQYHEKEAMMNKYLAFSKKDFVKLNDYYLDAIISDCKSALATKNYITAEECTRMAVLIRQFESRLHAESPTKESHIVQFETIATQWLF